MSFRSCLYDNGQSNLPKDDIARLVMSYAKEILTISSFIFARWQYASRHWSCRCIWKGEVSDVVIECLRRSNQQESLLGKIWGGRIERCQPNFKMTWERHEAVVCRRNRVDIFCRLSTIHAYDNQTEWQTNHGTVTSTPMATILTCTAGCFDLLIA